MNNEADNEFKIEFTFLGHYNENNLSIIIQRSVIKANNNSILVNIIGNV